MDKGTAELLNAAAQMVEKIADSAFELGDSNAASIIRQAGWQIENAIPTELRAKQLLKQAN